MTDKLDLLKQRYISQLPQKIQEIENLWENILTTKDSGIDFTDIHRAVHTLRGSCAVFGLKKISTAAKKLEHLLVKEKDEKDACDLHSLNEINQSLEILKDVYLYFFNNKFEDHGEEEQSGDDVGQGQSLEVKQVKPSICVIGSRRIVVFIESGALLKNQSELQQKDYIVDTYTDFSELISEIKKELVRLVVLDVQCVESRVGTMDTAVSLINEQVDYNIPFIFISNKDDFNMRLKAVRLGAIAYFMKPFDTVKVIEKLEELVAEKKEEPYRVLIVDDEPNAANYYSTLLEQNGIKTLSVNDPMQVFVPLKSFNPDLIIMDMYMPGCTGVELSQVIRQMDDYVKIPIVFLSIETDIDKQLIAMSKGADDFLTKSINPAHLISSITIRAERMRMLRSLDRLRDYSQVLEQQVQERTSQLKTAYEDLKEKSLLLEKLNKSLEQKVIEEVEKRRQNEQLLIQQSKMAAMGEMVGVIAHQWKQPLNSIAIIVQDIMMEYEFGDITKDYISKMIDEVMEKINFMTKTGDHFRNFLKPSKKKELFNIIDATKDVLSILSPVLLKTGIKLESKYEGFVYESDLLVVEGYHNEFKQVLLNIFNNAKDAIEKIKTGNESYDGHIYILYKKVQNYITLEISDNGGGMNKDVIEHIFDNFFSTKGQGGTGIGLYMSKTIVEGNMGGKLTARNIKNGALFTIELKLKT